MPKKKKTLPSTRPPNAPYLGRAYVVSIVLFFALLVTGMVFFVKSSAVFDANEGDNQAGFVALASRIRQVPLHSNAEPDRRARRSSVRVLKPISNSFDAILSPPVSIPLSANLSPLKPNKHKRNRVKHGRKDAGENRSGSAHAQVQRVAEEFASSPASAPSNRPDTSPSDTAAELPNTFIPPARGDAKADSEEVVGEDAFTPPPTLSPTHLLGPFGSASAGEIRGGAPKPRILVATYFVLAEKFTHLDCDYTEFLVRNRGGYAARHGYGYSIVTRNLETNRPLAWGKVRAMQRWMGIWHDDWNSNVAGEQGLPPYLDAAAADRAASGKVDGETAATWDGPEWIFLIDADAFITNPDVRIDELIDTNYDIILTEDINNINSGTMLLKNGPWLADYWATIWDMTQYLTHAWWEQAAIIDTMRDPFVREHIKILDQRTMNSYPQGFPSPDGWWQEGDFIVHFAGVQEQFFSDSFRKFGVALREEVDFAGCARR